LLVAFVEGRQFSVIYDHTVKMEGPQDENKYPTKIENSSLLGTLPLSTIDQLIWRGKS
jgi:hypothetical protein